MNAEARSNAAESRREFGAPPDPTASGEWAEVDGYQVHRLVRRTPSIDVYFAYHRATRGYREVVVVQRRAGVDQAALRESLESEIVRAGALQHAGISPVDDVGFTHDGRLYFAAERPVGRPLRDIIAEQGPPGDQRAFDLGLAIVDAVAAAHDHGVVHGRLDPDSIVVIPQQAGQPERVVVLGFGTETVQDAIVAPGALAKEQSPFVSPERVAGAPPSLRGDVFSLGSLITTLLRGGPPPVGRAAAGGAALGEVNPGLREIIEVLQRARAADPRDRYASAGSLEAALRAASEPSAVRASGLRPVARPPLAPPLEEYVPTATKRTPTAATPLAFTPSPSPQDIHVAPGPRGLGRRGALIAAGVAGVLSAGGAALAWRNQTGPGLPSPLDTTAQVRQQVTPPPAIPGPAATSVVAQAPATIATPSPELKTPELDPTRPVLATPPPRAEPVAKLAEKPVAKPAENRPVASASSAIVTGGTTTGSTTTASAAGDVVAPGPSDARAAAAAPAGAEPAYPAAATTEAARSSSTTVVWATFAEYANAIEARDLDRMRRVYPGMSEQQRQAWATFFGSIADLHAPLIADQITVSGATAQVRVRGTYEYQNLRPHRAERSPVRFKLTLAREVSGWRVRGVE